MAPLFLGNDEVFRCLKGKWTDLITAVEGALGAFSDKKVVQPVRSCVPVDQHNGTLFSMQAYSIPDDALAAKLVTVFPQNKAVGLPSIQATVLLYNAATGGLQAVMDGLTITSMRTAAASAVATKFLAPQNSQILAILGAGEQARSHYQALTHLLNFKQVNIWNIHKETAQKLVDEIKLGGRQAFCFETVRECVQHADVIVTVTMAQTPILQKEWIKQGAHINAVGAPLPTWQELSVELMKSSTIYVDSMEGALVESGDIILSEAKIYAEIGEVVLGRKKAFHDKVTVFKSLGMAIEDVVAAKLVYDIFLTTQH